MSDMRMMGAFSGIDMSMIDKIMEAEAAKGVRFTQQKEQYTRSQNAWKDMNTRLDSLNNRFNELQKPDTFNSKSVKTTGPNNVSVSASTSAATGNYRVQVEQLATQTRLVGKPVNLTEDGKINFPDGLDKGTLTFDIGEENPVSIEILDTDNLRSISDKINSATNEFGIRSSIIDNRLILTHTEYGEKNITIGGTLVSELGLEGVTEELGQNAQFNIDGLNITRSSNTINDVIDGLTFNLTNVHNGTDSTVVSITEDMSKAADAMQKFVEQYNSTQNFIKSQLSVGDPSASNNETGTLVGDGTLMRLQSSLRSMMMSSVDSNGTSIKGLKDLGVTVDRNGTASFDRSVMEKQVRNNPNEIKDFFDFKAPASLEKEDGTPAKRPVFFQDMKPLINQYISSSNGIIKTRRDTYDRMIHDVNQRIERFEERLEMRKDRYIRQFSALDTAMMQAESQMDFMFSQLGMNQGK